MGKPTYDIVVDKKQGVARVRESSHSIAQNRLGKWEKKILYYLSDVCFDNQVNRVAVSRQQIANVFAVIDGDRIRYPITRRNVAIVLNSLERKGFIKKENQQTGTGQYLENIYTVVKPHRVERNLGLDEV